MEKPKTSIIWKTSDRRAKRSEIWASGVSVQYILWTVKWLRSFWGHWVHFRFLTTLYLKNGFSISETEWNWKPGWIFIVYRVLLRVKYFWKGRGGWDNSGVIWCISDFKQPCISKIAGHRVKRGEIWALRWVFSVYMVLSKVKWLRSFWDHLVHFQFSTALYLENGWS